MSSNLRKQTYYIPDTQILYALSKLLHLEGRDHYILSSENNDKNFLNNTPCITYNMEYPNGFINLSNNKRDTALSMKHIGMLLNDDSDIKSSMSINDIEKLYYSKFVCGVPSKFEQMVRYEKYNFPKCAAMYARRFGYNPIVNFIIRSMWWRFTRTSSHILELYMKLFIRIMNYEYVNTSNTLQLVGNLLLSFKKRCSSVG